MECKPTELQQQRRWNHYWRASVVDFFLAFPTVENSSKSRPFGRGRNDMCQTHSTSGETPSQIAIYVCCEEGEKYTMNSAFEFLYQWHLPQCFPCRRRFPKPTTALFVLPPSKIKPYPDLKLSAADRLGIRYKGIAKDAGKAASLPGFARPLNAQFGCLPNEVAFRVLLREYCGWSETKSRIVWDPKLEYTLLGFLPPLMQAVSGLHFHSSTSRQRRVGLPSFIGSRIKKYDRTQEVLLTSNCWGFSWEVLFQADNADVSAITISTADPTSAWREFTGPAFDLIQSTRTQPDLVKLEERKLRNKNMEGGDVLLIWHQNVPTASGEDLYLDHVATVTDED
eukprot:scaffold5377_cov63-Cylindrotheca_fusiformis.AAC.3